MNKPWYRSKTIWLAITQAVFGVVVVLGKQYPEVGTFLMVKSALDIFMRFLTETTIGG